MNRDETILKIEKLIQEKALAIKNKNFEFAARLRDEISLCFEKIEAIDLKKKGQRFN